LTWRVERPADADQFVSSGPGNVTVALSVDSAFHYNDQVTERIGIQNQHWWLSDIPAEVVSDSGVFRALRTDKDVRAYVKKWYALKIRKDVRLEANKTCVRFRSLLLA